MKALQIIIIAALSLGTLKASATNEKSPIETIIVNTKTVQVSSSIKALANEIFEIQRSYNNNNFKTIAVVLGTNDANELPTFKINDKVKENAGKIYYRIIKIETNGSSVVVGTSIVESN